MQGQCRKLHLTFVLSMYITKVILYLIDDVVMGKAIPTTLKGASLE